MILNLVIVYNIMHYNESSVPRISRNPLQQRSTNYLSRITSKKSSATFNQSSHIQSQSRFQTSQSRKSMDETMSISTLKKNISASSAQKVHKETDNFE